MTHRFAVGSRFKAPDGSIGLVVHQVMDGQMPGYNVMITGDPGMDHGHIWEYEVCAPGWMVADPGSDMFRVVRDAALIVPCQNNEAFPGSCDRPTMAYSHRPGAAYVTCPRHGTFLRVEGRTLRVSKVRNVEVVA